MVGFKKKAKAGSQAEGNDETPEHTDADFKAKAEEAAAEAAAFAVKEAKELFNNRAELAAKSKNFLANKAAHDMASFVAQGAAFLLFLSCMYTLYHIWDFNVLSFPLTICVLLYFLGFALVMFAMESHSKIHPAISKLKLFAFVWMKFATRLTGRGMFYLWQGILATHALGYYASGLGNIGGYAMVFAGIMLMAIGALTTSDVAKMKTKLQDKYALDQLDGKSQKLNPDDWLFQKYDSNNDGYLSKHEVSELIKEMTDNSMTNAQISLFLAAVDADEDGKISKEELKAWWDSKSLLM